MKQQQIINASITTIWQKWSVTVKVMPVIILVAILKFLSHQFGWEIMELNALFTSLVAGTIFLIGFLITGVLSDYKESEKIPSELASSFKALSDDTCTIYHGRNSAAARPFMDFQKAFIHSLLDWFYRKERTKSLLDKISMMNQFLIELDKEGVPAPYIVKMKNDQNNIRKMIMRIDTVRDTSFISSAYAIVEAMGFLVAIGLIVMKIEPFYASLFFTLLVTFLIAYMVLLIKDLDNPFDYSEKGESGTEISLKPLRDHISSIQDLN
ncbi:MAG TPA: hypothetical protein PKJ10_00475 [Smithella sp.]|nr:hypothetical protein [Smithella sp.]